MGYSISRQENLDKAVRRVIREELEKALDGVGGAAEPVHGVHEARKSLKKIRALLRLIRPGIPRGFFCGYNVRFRDAGRLLSPLRDVHVQRKTLQELDIPANTIALTYANTLAEQEKSLSADAAVRKKLRLLLLKIHSESARWPAHRLDNTTLCFGFRKVYKTARRAFSAARRTESTANLHEWRKRTKDLLYALELTEEFDSSRMKKLLSRTKRLADFLGTDHDLFFIGENICQQQVARPRLELGRIEKRIRKRRAEIQRCAFRLGKKVFEKKTSVVERRIARRFE